MDHLEREPSELKHNEARPGGSRAYACSPLRGCSARVRTMPPSAIDTIVLHFSCEHSDALTSEHHLRFAVLWWAAHYPR